MGHTHKSPILTNSNKYTQNMPWSMPCDHTTD